MITPPSRSAPLATLLQRVREQYRDTPGLTLTKPQATRLFGVAPSVCAAMLSALVRESFLSRRGEGLFVRATITSDAKLNNREASRSAVGSSTHQRATLTVESVKMLAAQCR